MDRHFQQVKAVPRWGRGRSAVVTHAFLAPAPSDMDGLARPSTCSVGKRLLDVILALLLLFLLAPLLLLIALFVRLGSPGPAIFRQTRLGLGGRAFSIFKFRTMRVMENGSLIRQATRDD